MNNRTTSVKTRTQTSRVSICKHVTTAKVELVDGVDAEQDFVEDGNEVDGVIRRTESIVHLFLRQ